MNKRIHESKVILYWIIGLLVYFVMPQSAVLAAGEFQADYDVVYAVAPTGSTIVTQNVILTNKQTTLYPQQYTILIDSQNIRNIIAYDNGGLIQTKINQGSGNTEINLPFNEHVVGLGKQLKFSLRYEDADIAKRNGKIWEVNIPGVTSDPDLETYTVSLRVPPTFGPNAYMSPLPQGGNKWSKDQMIRGGISAAYGISQSFKLNLRYYIENASVAPHSTEIALPPNTAFQEVTIESIDPRPKSVLTDSDGNWLAQYDLLPAQRQEIQVNAIVSIRLTPSGDVVQDAPDKEIYTRPLKYWESESKEIQHLATQYKTPRDIYNYVVQTLSYNVNRVKQIPIRKGALQAISSPKDSICMEFTDLFIAIARSAGIPARQVLGYAYTTNSKLRPLALAQDVLHAWPEYYDYEKKHWIPVDPTWANTTGGVNYFDKLDFNHIVFAVQGQSSTYPYPAGFYKKESSNSKDVSVEFYDKQIEIPKSIMLTTFNFPKSVTSGFSASGSVVIENSTGIAISNSIVSIQSSPFDVAIHKELNDIPPFAKISIPVSIPLPNYLLKGHGTITATVNNEVSTYDFEIKPLIYIFIIPIFCLALICITVALVLMKPSFIWRHLKK